MNYWVRIRPTWNGYPTYVNTLSGEIAVEMDGSKLVGLRKDVGRYLARIECGLRQGCEELDWLSRQE